ncbi:MAG: FAD-dependent oxidoreductase [Acidobacteria bacterium]|nr:FAD-dependent oxidoreductase [Acidobacteriota bacterium]
MKPTDIQDPEYFHKVVDCQYACPAHTPVPEYIRLIAQGKYSEAYMINWDSNVFPGVLGRTCDRPCEPACRRGRVEAEPVAICRLKRVAADNKDEVKHMMPQGPFAPNGKKVALIGGGPASLTVARDLAPLGYEIHLFDEQKKAGGFMLSQIPSFRLPETVLDEEVNYVLDLGIHTQFNKYVDSLKEVLAQDYDAVFVGTGAPRGKDLPKLPGRWDAKENVHIGIDWLSSVAFEHTKSIGRRVLVIGGGNTAMDCCRTSRRLGGEDVKVVVRSPFADMKASPWEKEDAMHEDIPIFDNHVPKSFVVEDGQLKGMTFEKVEAVYDANGKRSLIPTGEPDVFFEADDVLMAIGQENAFPWIERDAGVEFGEWDMPVVDRITFQTTNPRVFIGGDAAFGPENIITAVAHGRKDRKKEVELGFSPLEGFKEAQRCLNCDAQTVFFEAKCIECDACVDVCPTSCITFTGNEEDEEALRAKLKVPALNLKQDLYVSDALKTARVMVKDEDVCLHCGLCAERCPTAAWDMQKFFYNVTKTYSGCGK